MDTLLRVLIVEDSEDDVLLLLRELRRSGYNVEHVQVQTAADMKNALEQQPWDIVLSDYSMPDFDAPAALNILKESGMDIPFIIVSGTIGEDTAVAALKAGAHDFIVKGKLARLVPAFERELREAENRRDRRKADAALNRKSLFVQLLQEVAVAANEALSIEQVLQFALDKVCAYLGWSVGHVYRPQPDSQDTFVSAHLWHLESAEQFQSFKTVSETIHFTRTMGIIGRVVDSRQSIWLKDLAEHKGNFVRYSQAAECGIQSGVAFPILVNNKIAAILEFFSTGVSEPDEPLVNVMTIIGTQLERVIERQQNEEALKIYNERLAALHTIDQAILAKQPAETVAQIVLEFIQHSIKVSRAGVTLLDFETREAYELATSSTQESQLPAGGHFSLEGFPDDFIARLQSGDVLHVNDLSSLRKANWIIPALEAEGLRTAAAIPLKTNGDLVGTLNLGSDTLDGFTLDHIQIARELADQLAIAIRQTRYLEEIERHTAELEQRVRARTIELQQTKNYIETILNSSSDTIITTSFDGVIKQVNPAFNDLFGYSLEEVFNQSILSFLSPDSVDLLLEAMTAVVKTIQPITIEITVRRKDGSLFDGDLALAPIIEDNKIKGIVSNLRDITERKRAEQEIRANEAKFRALIEFAPNPIVIVDAVGQIVLVNGQVKNLLGYEMEELIGQSVAILIPERFRESHAINQAHYMTVPRTHLMGEKPDLVIRHKNGSEIPVEIGLSPIQTGTELLVMTYVVDMTARRQLEESLRGALAKEKELSEIRTRFISMVSHDFRTPLSIIRSSANILESYFDRMDVERKASQFNKIQMQIDRMVALLNDVLTVSQADAGKTPFNPVMLDLDQCCRNLADEFQGAPDMKHTLVYTFSGEPIPAPIDEKLLQQAIINLLTNAFKYSPPGSSVYWDLSFDKDNAIIRIQDSGIGIPEADLPHLFEPFHRAGNVGTTEGTGLGMAIVKRSVEAHGGVISCESQVGVGTTFTVRLPLR